MTRSVGFMAAAVFMLSLIAGLEHRLNKPINWPTDQEDQGILAQVNQEMEDEYGKAWSTYRHIIARTNSELFLQMFTEFRQRVDAYYGVQSQAAPGGSTPAPREGNSYRW